MGRTGLPARAGWVLMAFVIYLTVAPFDALVRSVQAAEASVLGAFGDLPLPVGASIDYDTLLASAADEMLVQTVDFVSLSGTDTTIDGKTREFWGPWFDGGSSAFHVGDQGLWAEGSEEYGSFALAPMEVAGAAYVDDNGDYWDESGDRKPFYSSIYTDVWDLSSAGVVTISFDYLFTDTSGVESFSDGIRVEVSNDGGETFTVLSEINEAASLGPHKEYIDWRKDECRDLFLKPWVEDCLSNIDESRLPPWDFNNDFWGSEDFSVIAADSLSEQTVFRIKAYMDHASEPKARVHVDNLSVEVTVDDYQRSVDVITPASDEIPDGAELVSEATFNQLTAGEFDWGPMVDGGRNAYLTRFLADNYLAEKDTVADADAVEWAVGLRYQYVEGEENAPGPNGEDNGLHQPDYSSILTANMDFTSAEDLAVEFDLTAYKTQFGADSIEIALSTNSGVDYYPVRVWRSGEDVMNGVRYPIRVVIPGNMTETGRLTTTTRVRIQATTGSVERQFYVDNLKLYTVGSGPGLAPANELYDWESAPDGLSVVVADTTATAPADLDAPPQYHLINSVYVDPTLYQNGVGSFNTGSDTFPCAYGAVEHTDLSHPEFGPHITMSSDTDLGTDVFNFILHQTDHTPLTGSGQAAPTPDTDKCRTDVDPNVLDYRRDRQRVEIKAYSESPEKLKSVEGETFYYSWKMRIPAGMGLTDKFTHLHQLKTVNSIYDRMPLITLTAVAAKEGVAADDLGTPAKVNLRYSPTAVNQVTLDSADLSEFEDRWVHLLEKVHYGETNEGRYEFMVLPAEDLEAEPIMSIVSDSLPTWKGGDFTRAKYGFYRSVAQGDKLNDEDNVQFADFVTLELADGSGVLGNLRDFGYFANEQAGGSGPVVHDGTSTYTITGTDGDDTIIISGEASASVAAANGVLTASVPQVDHDPSHVHDHLADVVGAATTALAGTSFATSITAEVNGTTIPLTVNQLRRLAIESGDGEDYIEIGEGLSYEEITIRSGPGDDTILGADGVEVVWAGAGSDIVVSGAGDDVLYGETGDDILIGGIGDDEKHGGAGTNEGLVHAADTVINDITVLPEMHGELSSADAQQLNLESLVRHVAHRAGPNEIVRGLVDVDGETKVSIESNVDELGAEVAETSTIAIDVDDLIRAETLAIDYEQAIGGGDDSDIDAAIAAINSELATVTDAYPYLLWRLRASYELTTVATVRVALESYIMPLIDADPDDDLTQLLYAGANQWTLGDGRLFFIEMASINDDFSYEIPESIGTAEGRYDQMDLTWSAPEPENVTGYFMAIRYSGPHLYRVDFGTSVGGTVAVSTPNWSNHGSHFIYFDGEDWSDDMFEDLTLVRLDLEGEIVTPKDPWNDVGQPGSGGVTPVTAWDFPFTDLGDPVQEGYGMVTYEMDVTAPSTVQQGAEKAAAQIVIVKMGGDAPDLSWWKSVSSSPDIRVFDYATMWTAFGLDGVKASPDAVMEYGLESMKCAFQKPMEVYQHPHRSHGGLSVYDKEILANMGYVAMMEQRGLSLDGYVYTDGLSGESFRGKEAVVNHLVQNSEMEQIIDDCDQEARMTAFGADFGNSYYLSFLETIMSDPLMLDLVDIFPKSLFDPFFGDLITFQAFFESQPASPYVDDEAFDIAPGLTRDDYAEGTTTVIRTQEKVMLRRLQTDDTEIVDRRSSSVPGVPGKVAVGDYIMSIVRLSMPAIGGNVIKAGLHRYMTSNFGDAAELVGVLLELRRLNPTDAGQAYIMVESLIESAVPEENADALARGSLADFFVTLHEGGVLTFIDAMVAVASFAVRMEGRQPDSGEDFAYVMGAIGDGLHMLKLAPYGLYLFEQSYWGTKTNLALETTIGRVLAENSAVYKKVLGELQQLENQELSRQQVQETLTGLIRDENTGLGTLRQELARAQTNISEAASGEVRMFGLRVESDLDISSTQIARTIMTEGSGRSILGQAPGAESRGDSLSRAATAFRSGAISRSRRRVVLPTPNPGTDRQAETTAVLEREIAATEERIAQLESDLEALNEVALQRQRDISEVREAFSDLNSFFEGGNDISEEIGSLEAATDLVKKSLDVVAKERSTTSFAVIRSTGRAMKFVGFMGELGNISYGLGALACAIEQGQLEHAWRTVGCTMKAMGLIAAGGIGATAYIRWAFGLAPFGPEVTWLVAALFVLALIGEIVFWLEQQMATLDTPRGACQDEDTQTTCDATDLVENDAWSLRYGREMSSEDPMCSGDSLITGIEGRSGRVIDQMTVHCGDGTTAGPKGGGGGSEFTQLCGSNMHVIGFHGRWGNSLDSIGLICYEPSTDEITRIDAVGGSGGGAFDALCESFDETDVEGNFIGYGVTQVDVKTDVDRLGYIRFKCGSPDRLP